MQFDVFFICFLVFFLFVCFFFLFQVISLTNGIDSKLHVETNAYIFLHKKCHAERVNKPREFLLLLRCSSVAILLLCQLHLLH